MIIVVSVGAIKLIIKRLSLSMAQCNKELLRWNSFISLIAADLRILSTVNVNLKVFDLYCFSHANFKVVFKPNPSVYMFGFAFTHTLVFTPLCGCKFPRSHLQPVRISCLTRLPIWIIDSVIFRGKVISLVLRCHSTRKGDVMRLGFYSPWLIRFH